MLTEFPSLLPSSSISNAGLEIARNLLEPLKAKYPGVTYADLWTFAGKVGWSVDHLCPSLSHFPSHLA